MFFIDVNFYFYSDNPSGKDLDSYSATLRNYHQIPWSKPIPNDAIFTLDDYIPRKSHALNYKAISC